MTARTPPEGPSDAGFTLIELLVSLTLLGLLSLVLFDGLHFGRRVWEASEIQTAAANRVRAIQLQWAREIERAYPELVAADPTRPHIDFSGSPDRLEFLTPASDNSGQLMRVTLAASRDRDNLTLLESRHPELAADPKRTSIGASLRNVSKVAFAYFGTDDPKTAPGWHARWESKLQLPARIRVQVAFADRRTAWPTFEIAPRVSADVSCTFDPLTKRCQGR